MNERTIKGFLALVDSPWLLEINHYPYTYTHRYQTHNKPTMQDIEEAKSRTPTDDDNDDDARHILLASSEGHVAEGRGFFGTLASAGSTSPQRLGDGAVGAAEAVACLCGRGGRRGE